MTNCKETCQTTMKNLLILHVNVEQETAVQQLFTSKSWNFCDLAKYLSKTLKNSILSAADWTLDNLLTDDQNISEEFEADVSNRQVESDGKGKCDKVVDEVSECSLTNAIHLSDFKKYRKELNHENSVTGELDIKQCDAGVTRVLRSRSNLTIHKRSSSQAGCELRKENQKCNKSSAKCRSSKTVVKKDCSERQIRNHKKAGSGADVNVELLNSNVDIADENSDETNDVDNNHCDETGTRDQVSDSSNNDVKEKYKCDNCSYVANIKSNLNRHNREIHSGVRFQCSMCEKSFKGKHDAKMHETHAHKTSLKCDECNKRFSSVSGLRNHSKTVHKKKSLYRCQHCKRTFFYKSHYLGHINKHLGVKPFACEKCKKPFRYKVACKLHERNCSNESFFETHHADGSKKEVVKQFLCDICGASGLNSKSSLKMHHFYAHSDRSQCVCTLCGKSLKGIYSLRRHMKTQHEDDGTRYPCSVCDRSFTQLQILKQHMKIHNKQYTCFCDTCGKGFLSQFKMKEHARTHTGEKPFVCSICHTYKSATKTNLHKHMKIHDKDRLPRQHGRKLKEPVDVFKNADHALNDSSQATCDTTSHHRPIYLQSMSGNVSGSNVFNEGQRQYTTLPGMPMENSPSRFPASNYSQVYNLVEDEGQHVSRGQGHDVDYDVGNSGGYYGNESGNESTDLSQGLNILTIAMNIVNPEQY